MIWVFLMLAIVAWFVWLDHQLPSGRERSRDFNRVHGTYRVVYSDGACSEPMCHDVATDYAKIFGGIVARVADCPTIPRESVACNGYCGEHYISPSCERHGG